MHSFWQTGVSRWVSKYWDKCVLSMISVLPPKQWFVPNIHNVSCLRVNTYWSYEQVQFLRTRQGRMQIFQKHRQRPRTALPSTQKTQDMKHLLEVAALDFYRKTDMCWLKVPAIQTLAFLSGIWTCFPSSRSGDCWFLSHISVCSSMSHSAINLHSGRTADQSQLPHQEEKEAQTCPGRLLWHREDS